VALVRGTLADEYLVATGNHGCDHSNHAEAPFIDDSEPFARTRVEILPTVEERRTGAITIIMVN